MAAPQRAAAGDGELDVVGAGGVEALERPLADRMLGLDLLFGGARCLVALDGRPETNPRINPARLAIASPWPS